MIFSVINQVRRRPGHCPAGPIRPFSTISQAAGERWLDGLGEQLVQVERLLAGRVLGDCIGGDRPKPGQLGSVASLIRRPSAWTGSIRQYYRTVQP
jgi:hypothetical protein